MLYILGFCVLTLVVFILTLFGGFLLLNNFGKNDIVGTENKILYKVLTVIYCSCIGFFWWGLGLIDPVTVTFN